MLSALCSINLVGGEVFIRFATLNRITSILIILVAVLTSCGKMDNLTPKKLMKFLNDTARLNKESVGSIDIYDKFSFLNVDQDEVNNIFKRTQNKKLCGRKIRFEVSNKKKKNR